MQEVVQNVQLVHNPLTSQELRSKADRFLYESFFRADQCWDILFEILQTSELPSEIHFFAAQFLRTKMAKNFRQINHDSLPQVQKQLLNLIKPYTQAPIILKQMGLAIADFSVQRPDWEKVVEDIVEALYPDHTLALLNILNCLPEEINSGRTPLAPPQKDAILVCYRKCAPQTLNVFEVIWRELPNNDNNASNKRLILECFASWSRVFDQIEADALLNSSLFKSCFQAICEQQTFTCACTALLEIIPISAKQNGEAWARIRNVIIDGVGELQGLLSQAIESNDSDSTFYLARLFILCVQELKADLCQRPKDLEKLLQVTIIITGMTDIQVSQQAFRFWTSLMEDRYEQEYRDMPNPTAGQADMFMAAAREGLKGIINSIKYPDNFENYDEEQYEEWYDHRQYGTEVINDLCRYLDARQFVQVVIENMQEPLKTWPKSDWRDIESCFHSLAQTHGAKTKETENIFKQLLDVGLQMKHNTHMQETITWLISAYSDLALPYPKLCPDMLKYCLDGLINSTDKKLQRSAATTLRDIAKYATDSAKAHLPDLLDVYKQLMSEGTNLDSGEICDFVWAICEVFNAIPVEQVCEAMNLLMEQPLKYLQKSIEQGDRDSIHHSLKIISEVFRRTKINDNAIQGTHPLVAGLEAIWSLIMPVMKRYNTDNDVMEKTTRIIKSTIRGGSQHFVNSKLATTILNEVVTVYKSSSKSCFLYLISVYVDEYGRLEATQELFNNCLLQIVEKTSELLQSFEHFTNDPDLVEDFYELLIRYFKRCPNILLQENLIQHIMEMTLRGFRIQHYEANKAVLLYTQVMIRQATDRGNSRDKHRQVDRSIVVGPQTVQLITNLLEKYGPTLMDEIVYAITNVSYRYLDDYCHILEAWFQLNPQQLYKHLTGTISKLNLDPVYPSKEEFVKDFFSFPQTADHKRFGSVKEFSQSCDRFQQTQNYHK